MPALLPNGWTVETGARLQTISFLVVVGLLSGLPALQRPATVLLRATITQSQLDRGQLPE